MQITDDDRIAIIKRCIASEAGWKNLADSIKSSKNPDAYNSCIDLFKKMAGDKEITLPGVDINSGEAEAIKIAYIDVLINQLDRYMQT